MKLSRNMRRRVRSLTRRQLVAYIFLDGATKIDEAETPVRDMTKKLLGDIVVSWGWSEGAEGFYKRIKDAKRLGSSNDDLFTEFYKKHTPPMEDMVARQRAIQLSLHDRDDQETGTGATQN